MTDTGLVERLRRDDDLVSRIEAADLIESLEARVAELEGALERLASPEAFMVPRVATEEETARMKYAEATLARKDTAALSALKPGNLLPGGNVVMPVSLTPALIDAYKRERAAIADDRDDGYTDIDQDCEVVCFWEAMKRAMLTQKGTS